LTVWTPAADARKRPVVVWLHGGAWQSGGGALPWYSGAGLARRGDVVVVGVNYRLAALGWLHQPAATSNVGLLDQELAIAWVKSSIAYLGGDPEQITLMGQSAGASCIALMLARGVQVPRVILQSGALEDSVRSAESADRLGLVLLKAAGAQDLEAARKLPVQELLAAQKSPLVQAALAAEGGRLPLFSPVADGVVIPLDISARLKDAAGRADVLAGSTLDEMRAFPGERTPEQQRAASEKVFGAPARRWVEQATRAGRHARLYRFEHAATERWAACHCIELPFVFGTLESFAHSPMLHGLSPSRAKALVDQLQAIWIRFIRGEPEQGSQTSLLQFK
jgi:para-nitrobenzyl esterase